MVKIWSTILTNYRPLSIINPRKIHLETLISSTHRVSSLNQLHPLAPSTAVLLLLEHTSCRLSSILPLSLFSSFLSSSFHFFTTPPFNLLRLSAVHQFSVSVFSFGLNLTTSRLLSGSYYVVWFCCFGLLFLRYVWFLWVLCWGLSIDKSLLMCFVFSIS